MDARAKSRIPNRSVKHRSAEELEVEKVVHQWYSPVIFMSFSSRIVCLYFCVVFLALCLAGGIEHALAAPNKFEAQDTNKATFTVRKLLYKRHALRLGGNVRRLSHGQQNQIDNIMSSLSTNKQIFFTKETIKVNSWHVSGRWWTVPASLPTSADALQEACTGEMRPICTYFSREKVEELPSVQPGAWGTCAIVGYGGNLIVRPRGSEIDSHTTVIRMGVVELEKYKETAGTKSTVVYIRDRRLRRTKGIFVHVDKDGFDIRNYPKHQRPKLLLYSSFQANGTGGWPVMSFGGDLTQHLTLASRRILRIISKNKQPPDPSSGMVLPLAILHSGYCSEVSIFGISTEMGARYWERKGRNLASNHNTAIEGLFWKYAAQRQNTTISRLRFFE